MEIAKFLYKLYTVNPPPYFKLAELTIASTKLSAARHSSTATARDSRQLSETQQALSMMAFLYSFLIYCLASGTPSLVTASYSVTQELRLNVR